MPNAVDSKTRAHVRSHFHLNKANSENDGYIVWRRYIGSYWCVTWTNGLFFTDGADRYTEPRSVQSECHYDNDNVAPTSDFFNRRPPGRRRHTETP